MSSSTGSVAIVGAGLSGSLLAILLARRGVVVDVYERRGDPRAVTDTEGRSINLGVSARGIRALREVGLWDDLRHQAVPMRGRMVHRPDHSLRFHPYGNRPDEILYSVDRRQLNAALVDKAEKLESVRCHFRHRCADLDRETGRLTLVDTSGATSTVDATLVVGADGAHSTVRAQLQRGGPAGFHQELLDWGYREVTIPSRPDGTANTPIEALHLWPSERGLVVAHPNRDNSLTGTVLLPHHPDPAHPDRPSFATLTDAAAVDRFFGDTFPELPHLVPDLATQFFAHPVGQLVTVRTWPWHHRDRVVLIGDAAHAVYPFYGQGMNSSLEDCLVLDACLRANPSDRAAALAHYQRLRKPHTDVLADLSARNFVELRDRLRSPWHTARAAADRSLNRVLGRRWQPLYTMVSHTTIPYGQALRRARRQDRMLAAAVGTVLAGAAVAGGAALRGRWAGRRR